MHRKKKHINYSTRILENLTYPLLLGIILTGVYLFSYGFQFVGPFRFPIVFVWVYEIWMIYHSVEVSKYALEEIKIDNQENTVFLKYSHKNDIFERIIPSKFIDTKLTWKNNKLPNRLKLYVYCDSQLIFAQNWYGEWSEQELVELFIQLKKLNEKPMSNREQKKVEQYLD